MSKTFYISCAIPYANGVPHIGHAYEVIAADALARFKRMDGYDVHFQTGMDEHGIKIEQTAQKQDTTPQVLVDKVSGHFHQLYKDLGITFDGFIRTTDPLHKKRAQHLWNKMVEKGDIYLDKYAGWYSVRDEAFFDESELTEGEGGKRLAPSGAPVEWVEEESYFFRLSAYQDKLIDLYTRNPNFIQPKTRYNEVMSFVKSGLRDLSVSRTTFKWGVPVPNADKHVMYVWVDALSNYITALGYSDEGQDALMKKFWPADIHMIGKDIIRFHAVYWPAFLMSAGLEMPKSVVAHGFIYNRGEKMSKSVGNVIAPEDIINTFGLDAVRYFLLRDVAFGQDGDISHEALVARINSNLANDFGNLAQRSLSMIAKNCGAAVPDKGAFTDADQALLNKAYGLLARIRPEMDACLFHRVLEQIWEVIGDGNRYVDEQAPWALKKTDPARMATVLYVLAETIRVLALLVQPFMPESMSKMLDQLAIAPDARTFAFIAPDHALVSGTPLPAPSGVFPRFVEEPKA